ncbi:MAG: hypothetical protein NT116_04300 [Candidatus Parcubacteria bacterium]|nr:hypothetical protein [Candidatus Parcubacteria bacterium]
MKKEKLNQKEWLLLAALLPILAYFAFGSLKYSLVTIGFEIAGFLGIYLYLVVMGTYLKGGEK